MKNAKLSFRGPGYTLPPFDRADNMLYGTGWPGHGGGTLAIRGGPGHGGGTLSSPFFPGHDGGPLSRPRRNKIITLGYLPELPDTRDVKTRQLADHESIARAITSGPTGKGSLLLAISGKAKPNLPSSIDLRRDVRHENYFTEVEDQEELGSCTANAVIGLVEYLIKAEARQTINLSRLFLYKVTRNLMNVTGDQGAYIRTTIKALKLFGCPPESRWPYDIGTFDIEPNAYLYSIANNFKALSYLRLDDPGEPGLRVLQDIKCCLADGYPAAFGFSVYSSIDEVSKANDYLIPFPKRGDQLEGGHAVLVLGYDDTLEALLIRNSWGTEWGDMGYAWLPYEYVLHGLARDFWTVLTTDWVALADFSR